MSNTTENTLKRKTSTSTAVKARYNRKAYKQFNVQIKPELYERITDYCEVNNLSRSQFLSLAISTLDNSYEE